MLLLYTRITCTSYHLFNFHLNINYIETYHPTLFSKLSDYDSAVTNGHYIEKYELVYENDDFDVFEKTTATYLYQKQSTKYATLAAQSIEYGVKENTFEGFASVKISNKQTQVYLLEEPFKHHMSGFAPIINFTQNNTPQTIKLKKIFKYIFFGTGLGSKSGTPATVRGSLLTLFIFLSRFSTLSRSSLISFCCLILMQCYLFDS